MTIDVKLNQIVAFDQEALVSLLQKMAAEMIEERIGLTTKEVKFQWNQGKVSAEVTFSYAVSNHKATEQT